MNYFDQVQDVVLDGWVDRHAIQPDVLEVTDTAVYCLLDDGRIIIITALPHTTMVTIHGGIKGVDQSKVFKIGGEATLTHLVKFFQDY
jgi:hypothetical protein